MKLLTFDDIKNLNVPPTLCYEWAVECISQKDNTMLPPKISIKQIEHGFMNVMPSVLTKIDAMGVKIVTRYPTRNPALLGQIMLYRQSTGEPLALMDGTYITALRTGAVATHSILTFAKSSFTDVGLIGLGNTARATINVLASIDKRRQYTIKLLRYKNQAEQFVERFKECANLKFIILDNEKELIETSEVVVSCVTYTDDLFADDECYKPGITVIPVHTRGFQNCDLFFDKVYADDCGHVKDFRYFSKFKNFAETSDVIAGQKKGRESDSERILVYNIGISIHDIYFAHKIYELMTGMPDDVELSKGCETKFWV